MNKMLDQVASKGYCDRKEKPGDTFEADLFCLAGCEFSSGDSNCREPNSLAILMR